LDFNRQQDFIQPQAFTNTSISIIGCGATGSHAALLLAQSGFGGGQGPNGFGTMKLFDFDIVELHNLPNQAFHQKHLGLNKAVATQDLIESKCGFKPMAFPIKVVDQEIAQSDYVLLLVDSMKARREIVENVLKYGVNTKLIVETRMGLTEGSLHCFNPNDPEQLARWVGSLYDDDKAEVSACGTSMSCGLTANMFSSYAVSRIIQHFDWTMGEHYLEKRGYENNMPEARHYSFYPEHIIG
jgi:molybdopterin/thiamine biosynthesis adenylyltransferase